MAARAEIMQAPAAPEPEAAPERAISASASAVEIRAATLLASVARNQNWIFPRRVRTRGILPRTLLLRLRRRALHRQTLPILHREQSQKRFSRRSAFTR